MKRIYAILLVAASLSIGSCELESNARYTGNHYSSNVKVQQPVKTQDEPKAAGMTASAGSSASASY